jgi:hypothetical protein
MAKKLDMSRVKEFFFQYGERVALFACIAAAVLLLVWGVVGASGPGTKSGEPWDAALGKASKSVRAQMNVQPEEEPLKEIAKNVKVPPLEWPLALSKVSSGPYINLPEDNDTRRRNPEIRQVLAGDETIQFDLIDRSFIGYEVNAQKAAVLALVGGTGVAGGPGIEMKPPFGAAPVMPSAPGGPRGDAFGAAGTGPNLARVLKPRQMLVVTAVFPMKQQVDEFVKALRMTGLQELQAARELPVFVGFNVVRDQVGPDGQKSRKELIYYDLKKKELVVDPALNKEVKEAIYDHANPRGLAPVVHTGLVTPLPILPEGMAYPKLRIKGDFWPEEGMLVEGNPDPAAGAAPALAAPGIVGGKPFGSAAGMPSILGPKGDGRPGPGQTMPPGTPAPGMPALGGDVEAKTEWLPLKKLEKTYKELADRLGGKYNIFHPFGQFPDDAKPSEAAAPAAPFDAAGAQQFAYEPFGFGAQAGGAGGPGAYMPPGGFGGAALMPKGLNPRQQPRGGGDDRKPGAAGEPGGVAAIGDVSKIYDAILRFVDVDVKPGYTYSYHIQVRVKNPNYGRKGDVVQMAWADLKELTSEWTETPQFTVPPIYHLFAVDQMWGVDYLGNNDPTTAQKTRGQQKKPDADHAVFQLHKWLSHGGDSGEYLVGDWAIVERVLVRKGDPIVGPKVVEEPTWNIGKGAFEMRSSPIPGTKGQKGRYLFGVHLDFIPTITSPDGKLKATGAPILVDIDGGKKTANIAKNTTVTDDAAVETLILLPDGRLIVRNSRLDVDAKIEDGSDEGTTRQERVQTWRKRNQAAIEGRTQQQPGGAGPGGEGTGGAPGQGNR